MWLQDHFIGNGPKPDTSDKKFHWNTENPKTFAYRPTKIDKMSKNSTDEIKSQNIYASMARMSTNVESPKIDFGDSLQLAGWILDSGATYYRTPEILNFLPGVFFGNKIIYRSFR